MCSTIPNTVMSGLSFTTFRADDVRKLSVKEITNPQTFDTLGHATTGGLHDLMLGPAEMDDMCDTCGQNGIHCPGHLGHITFPLPVYNPLFFRTLYTIMKATCFSCHRFLVRSERVLVSLHQHKLLQYGLMDQAEQLGHRCNVYLQDHDPKRTTTILESEDTKEDAKVSAAVSDQAVISGLVQLVEEFVKEALCGVDKNSALRANLQKNLVDVREQMRKEIASLALVQTPRVCAHCGELRRTLRNEYNNKIFFSARVTNAQKRKKKQQATKLKATRLEQTEPDLEELEQMDEDEAGVVKEGKETLDDRAKLLSQLKDQVYLTPVQAREHLRELWSFSECRQILQQIFGSLSQRTDKTAYPTDVFFLELMPVPPTRFRPVQLLKGQKYENEQTANLSKALKAAQALRDMLVYIQKEKAKDQQSTEDVEAIIEKPAIPIQISMIPGHTNTEKLHNAWIRLQTYVNGIVDSSLDKLSVNKHPGIKQLLEKKEGLFRKHMMGKRVDYAARSVISPDPYINMDEVGIPEVFAVKLTYPEPVTPWNVAQLSQAVINGPDVHPGAAYVENEDGYKVKLTSANRVQREALAKQLLKPMETTKCVLGRKKVYRHLRDGDVLLLNRQPTLHRPSIQAHKAKVLRGEKTLRLHYANCKAYNADFDGDEMNAHFPQNEVARAEAYNIVNTANQYLVPKDGTPLAGLIQDHVVSGVLLSIRGRFFQRADYQQLVYSGLMHHHNPITFLKPTMLKPHRLWSGKQVISTVLLNLIPKDKPALSMIGKAKIGPKSWLRCPQATVWKPGGRPLEPDELSENCVIFREGELLTGVLDKAHYGPTPFGLVHCCYEIYGPEMASTLLTSLAKLFTAFLQMRGFTLGVEDILVTDEANAARHKLIETSTLSGDVAAAKAFGVNNAEKTSKIAQKFRAAQFAENDGALKELDLCVKSVTDEFQNEITKACMPYGLHKLFPSNNLQLMVQSGSKGSSVNTMQISCLLGQIELEGRRPPLMCTGRALPSFLPYDTSPRAGGFVSGRFLTGIQPQEYFFHCMAGREGLVDTAVKTSRSGYLQRCIIKHLEGLMVAYDLTVRDSDGSVIQFQYGEDSLDILGTPFLTSKQIPFIVQNHHCLLTDEHLQRLAAAMNTDAVERPRKKVMKKLRKYERQPDRRQSRSPFVQFCEALSPAYDPSQTVQGRTSSTKLALDQWNLLSHQEKKKYRKLTVQPIDPINATYRPDLYLGATSENHQRLVDEVADTIAYMFEESATPGLVPMSRARYNALLNVRHLRALVEPGQAVGLLAAQSIGEPSTQMTLNTFHFAGRGEMNVTLGIPRLREILMTASRHIMTPAMEVPVLAGAPSRRTRQLQLTLSRVTFDKVLASTRVVETTVISGPQKHRLYRIRMEYLTPALYKDKYYVTPEKITRFVERTFLFKLSLRVRKMLQRLKIRKTLSSQKARAPGAENAGADAEEGKANDDGGGGAEAEIGEGVGEDDDDDVMDDDQNDGDATADRNRRRQIDDQDYDGEEEERDEMGDKSESDGDSGSEYEGRAGGGDDDDDDQVLDASMIHRKKNREKRRSGKEVTMDEARINGVLQLVRLAVDYKYDAVDELWSEVTFELPLSSSSKFDMTSVVELMARSTVVWETSQIKRGYLSQNKMAADPTAVTLKTEGVNIQEMLKHDDILDLNKLYSNDIHAIANSYGIEAAGRVIVKELRSVFAAYGIDVNYRHLSLIADYMTFEGHYKPFNRMAMESSASPLQKMTFETAMHFIKSATLSGAHDNLQSPSSRLVVGQPVYGGTGCFQLNQPLSKI